MAQHLSRRRLLQNASAAGLLLASRRGLTQAAATPFQPSWESLQRYQTPSWFQDAKFGIWAHWSAQCVPEQGDWYARKMYIQGEPQYDFHCKTYGHPSEVGFMQIDHMWKVDRWEPDRLMQLYREAGARYFMSLGCHHDNLDTWNSKHHAWNTTRVGPGKDIIATWRPVVREHGLRFGISNHTAHSWHWFQPAYGYDPVGPKAGVRYDAYTLTKADGKGKWWDGLDPQELYNGRLLVLPDGISSIEEMRKWHAAHDGVWSEALPPQPDDAFAKNWLARCKDMIDQFDPDLIYFDDDELPLQQYGLEAAAYYYNRSIERHRRQECVLFAKHPKPGHEHSFTLDIERSRSTEILAQPWQTDTCIGDWHYNRARFDNHSYKKPMDVIALLADVISKNGNLLLSIPVRGDGTIDEDEHAFLVELARWVPLHGEAIYGTRPYKVYGEGPPEPIEKNFSEKIRPHTAEDIRFTTHQGILYAFVLGWPADGKVRVKTLRAGGEHSFKLGMVEMIGLSGKLPFEQTSEAAVISVPGTPPNPYCYVLRIRPA